MIGETIRRIRERLGMSQEEFAKNIGCQQSAVSKFELGRKIPSLKTAKQIINLAKERKIKIKLEDIFSDDE